MPDVPGPEDLPTLASDRRPARTRGGVDRCRSASSSTSAISPTRSPRCRRRPHTKSRGWFRAAGRLGDDRPCRPRRCTFVSDLTLLSAGFARLGGVWEDFIGASLDHSVWFHRPVRADEWFLYETDSPAAVRPGAVLRADLGRRRYARRDRRPEGLIRSLED